MGLIFGLSYRVIIWLGPEVEGSQHAIHKLQRIGGQIEVSNDGWRFRSESAKNRDWSMIQATLPFDERTRQDLTALFSREYFRRVWVMQEFLLANPRAMIHCGHDKIPVYHFRRAVEAFFENSSIPAGLSRLIDKALDLTSTRSSINFLNLLTFSQSRDCGDPKDKIYGVLSLAPPLFASQISLDYSLSTTQVYLDAMLQYTGITRRLELLSSCCQGASQMPMPSWVPDWSVLPSSSVQVEYSYQAAGLSRAVFHYQPPDSLEVKGVVCATINSVSTPIHSYDDARNTLQAYKPDSLDVGISPTGESMLDSWLRMVIFDQSVERYPDLSYLESISELKSAERNRVLSGQSSTEASILSHEVYEWIRTACVLKTEDGYLGFGPYEARSGKTLQ